MGAVELKPVNGWSVEKPRYQGYVGKYRDAEGYGLSGWFEREYRHTKHVVALNNGHVMSRYRFAKVVTPFSSPMHRWENLWFCGGWSTQGSNGEFIDNNEYLLQAVVDGLKPIGFLTGKYDDITQYVEVAERASLPYVIRPGYSHHLGYYDLAVAASQKAVGELFDLNALYDAYVLMDCGWVLRHAEYRGRTMHDLHNKSLTDFLTDWDYANPKDEFDLIKTGFLLGYPIESTVACINGAR